MLFPSKSPVSYTQGLKNEFVLDGGSEIMCAH